MDKERRGRSERPPETGAFGEELDQGLELEVGLGCIHGLFRDGDVATGGCNSLPRHVLVSIRGHLVPGLPGT
jgi:hypothetical protein